MQFEQGMILISAASNIVPGKLWGQRVGVGQSHTRSLCSWGTGLNGWENNVAVSRLGAFSFRFRWLTWERKVLTQCQGHFPWRRKETCKPATHQSVGDWLGSGLVSVWAWHTKSLSCTLCPSSVFEIYPVTRSSVGSCGGAGKARPGPGDAGEWSWSHFGQTRCKKGTGSKSRNGDKPAGS